MITEFGNVCGDADIYVSDDSKIYAYDMINIQGNVLYTDGTIEIHNKFFGGSIHNSGGSLKVLTGGEVKISLSNNVPCGTTISLTSCIPVSFTSPSGKYFYDQSGRYLDTLLGSAGCDSTINIDVAISTNDITYLDANECDEYTSPSGQSN